MQDPQYHGCGDTDGIYEKKRYFSCQDNNGLFLSLAALKQPVTSHRPSQSLLPHSYLLLKDTPPYSRGALIELSTHDRFRGHAHLWYTEITSVTSDSVAPLTEEECVLLDAIGPGNEEDADRYSVYNTPGKLAWGVGLKVGDTVMAQLPDKSGVRHMNTKLRYATAIVRAIGVDIKYNKIKQRLFGVEITVSYIRLYIPSKYHDMNPFFCK